MEFNFNDFFEANYEKIKAMLKKNRKKPFKIGSEEYKKQRSEMSKKIWADKEKRQRQSELVKQRWAKGEINPEMIYHKNYYFTQYKLTDLETKEITVYNGLKEFYTALGYASNGGLMKQSGWPNNIHNRERTKNYSLEIIKNKGDLK